MSYDLLVGKENFILEYVISNTNTRSIFILKEKELDSYSKTGKQKQ